MEHLKRLNVQKLPLGRTPRRVLYHTESKTLIVMRTDYGPDGGLVSDVCCVDPLSGANYSCYTLDAGEVARSIQLWKRRQEQLLLVGTSLIGGGGIMSSGEAERYLHRYTSLLLFVLLDLFLILGPACLVEQFVLKKLFKAFYAGSASTYPVFCMDFNLLIGSMFIVTLVCGL